jgi:hypothetical protein
MANQFNLLPYSELHEIGLLARRLPLELKMKRRCGIGETSLVNQPYARREL